jgi:hypothetical protein
MENRVAFATALIAAEKLNQKELTKLVGMLENQLLTGDTDRVEVVPVNSNPLVKLDTKLMEVHLAQAFCELTGHMATVRLVTATHHPAYLDAGHSKLQIGVTFAPLNPEDGEDLPEH